MHIHILQHVASEGPGYIAQWIEENKHQVSYTRFYESSWELPSLAAIDALIIMGGPMGVHDESIYPWLPLEKTYIRNCIGSGKKVLGICLGAQLIASSLGAAVHKAPHIEIGWFPVMLTGVCKQLDWFRQLFERDPLVFHWHGDQFAIPAGAVNLLSSEANNNQAFAFDKHVLGLQFHLEVTEESLTDMVDTFVEDLKADLYIQTETEIRNSLAHIVPVNRLMHHLLDQFFK